jgi:hypothetical protein
MEAMSLTSGARSNRGTRVLRRTLHSTLGAALIISALIGRSGGVASAQSGPIVNDPLTDPTLSTSWFQAQRPDGISTFYSDDGFHIALSSNYAGGYTLESTPNLVDALNARGADSNQSIEVDATRVGTGSDSPYEFGIACRDSLENGGGYVLWVGSDSTGGSAGIFKVVSDASGYKGVVEVVPPTDVPADTGYHLRADCNGSRLTLFVNGAKVAEGQDGDYKSGRVGLFAYSPDATGVDVAFTNLTISRP